MSDHNVNEIVRRINPAGFSAEAHGAGFRIEHRGAGKVGLHEGKLLGRLFAAPAEAEYYVRATDVPRAYDGWTFQWSEGASAISLEFDSTFELRVEDADHATRLVEALHAAEPPGEALYKLVNSRLHEALVRWQREYSRKSQSLLSMFRSSAVGVGESEALNEEVSGSVRGALGGAHFRIGFRLKSAPPMQIEVRHRDKYTLADSRQEREVETTVLLELDNYQTYKKAGLETEEAIRRTVAQSITQSVRRLLFAKRYYDVVRSFSGGAQSIDAGMRQLIQEDAARIGYRLEMFQTFPGIAALDLLEPLRIDLPDEKDAPGFEKDKYVLKNAAGHVQVGVSLSVRAEDVNLLELMLDPDESDVRRPIIEKVRQLLRDEIRQHTPRQFNLEFPDLARELEAAIVRGLAAHGLRAKIINFVPAPTEDAARFRALRGRTVEFGALIASQADLGAAEEVEIRGNVEVTGISPDHWERFEAKDFGFRHDSSLTEAQVRRLAAQHGIAAPEAEAMPWADRKALAVEIELAEIRERVRSVLRETLSKVPQLAALWRSLPASEQIVAKARELAASAIRDEFGLTVELRGMLREETPSELTRRLRRTAEHELLRSAATIERNQELERLTLAGQEQQRTEEKLGEEMRAALGEQDNPLHQKALEDATRGRDAQAGNEAGRLTLAGATKALDDAGKDPGQAPPSLPWDSKSENKKDGR